MKHTLLISVSVAISTLAGCRAEPEKVTPEPTAAASQTTTAATQPAKHDESEPDECSHDPAVVPDKVVTATDPVSGKPMEVVGAKLAGISTVKVADLVAKPEQYEGKVVRVEGNVSAMCHHRRGWFAVQDEGDRSGANVRVTTAPAFLVPAGSIGKKARAEGKVAVITVRPGAARHYAKDHKLGNPDEINGPVRSVVLRATGAEFL